MEFAIDEGSAVLTVTDGVRRWRYSPAGWPSVEDSFGRPVHTAPSAPDTLSTKPPVPERRNHVTTKDTFTEEEWTRIVRAPFVAGLAISLADPGGPIEAAKETMATLKSATNPPSREQLLTEVALDVQTMTQQKKHPLKGYKPESGSQILDELRTTHALVAAKATPDEARAYGAWLTASAQAAAEAAKDGGFMGFHAKRISDGEQAMLDQVRQAVTD